MPNSKKPKDAGAMFARLAQTERSAAPVPSPEPDQPPAEAPLEVATPKRQGRKAGRRGDPNYTQIGPYIRKDIDQRVKKRLADLKFEGQEIDLSALVDSLLEEWLNQQNA